MEHEYKEDIRYKKAKKRVKEIQGFYTHLLVYILVNIFIFAANSSIFELGLGTINISFGDLSLPFFWGIGLFAHWATVFGLDLLLGKNWEENKIREVMEKEEQQTKTWK